MLKSIILTKYYDSKLVVTDINNAIKIYSIHKIMLANDCAFFEMLFDNEVKQIYELTIPFELSIFDIIINNIYNIKTDIEKDLNYYENMLYALYYLQSSKEDIKKHLNNLIKYIEFSYHDEKHIDTTIFFDNLNKFNLMDEELKQDFINRIKYDSFIENYYDKENKKLVFTQHCGLDCFDKFEKTFDIEGIKFSVYNTRTYSPDQVGFWLSYEKNKDYIEERTIQSATGIVEIYSGINYYEHKLKDYKRFKNRNIMKFDLDSHRYGYISEYEDIDTRITFYKLIIQFE